MFEYILFSLLYLVLSFLGSIAILRLPRFESLNIRPYCPTCSKNLSVFEQIPIISYIFLQGKCSKCKSFIDLRYLFIEIAMLFLVFAPLFLPYLNKLGYISYQDNLITTIPVVLLSANLLILAIIDWEYKGVPKSLLASLYLISIFYYLFNNKTSIDFLFHAISAMSVMVIYAIILAIGYLTTKRAVMGLADPIIISAIILSFGKNAGITVVISSAFLLVAYYFIKRQREFPYIPFIFAGYLITLYTPLNSYLAEEYYNPILGFILTLI